MQNILFLTKYSRSGASSRYRSFQYLPFLDKAGVNCDVSPLFDDAYLVNRYKYGNGSKTNFIHAFLRRIGALLKIRNYHLLVIEYELLPYFPALLERLLHWFNIPYIVDYDDALFHQYDQHDNPLIQKLLGKKIATVMRYAEIVVVGNAYLAEYAHKAGAQRVEIIPTVIDLERYPFSVDPKANDIFTIGWIGSPSSAKYLQQIAPALAEVCRDGKAKLRLIGSGEIELPAVDYEVLAWSEESEVDLMHSFDVGIMPLPDEPWARGKCGFKLIQYMACGLPIVASPVGVNREIVEDSANGFLAIDHADWVKALTWLREHPEKRMRMGVVGRKKVETEYCLQVTGSKFVNLLQSIMVNRKSAA